LYQLSPVDIYTVAQNQYMGKQLDNCHVCRGILLRVNV